MKKKIEKALMLLVCLVIGIMLAKEVQVGASAIPQMPEQVAEGWYYIENDEKVEVSLPTVIEDDSDEALVLYNDSLPADWKSMSLTARGAVYDMTIAVGDEVLYRYDDTSFTRNVQMASKVHCTADLPADYNGETVTLTFYNTQDGVYKLPGVFVGSGDSVILYYLSKDIFQIISVLIMLILAVITISSYFYLKHVNMEEKRFANISYFLFFCGCWFLTDSSTIQTLSGTSPVIKYLSFYAFMLLAIPMLHFIRNTGNMKSYRVIDYFIYAFYANVLVQSLLNYAGVFDFVDMLFVTHLLLASGVLTLVCLLWKEYQKEKNRELFLILVSFGAVGSGGVLALLLYWILKISYYDVFFDIGILAFIILLVRNLIIVVVKNFRFKTEMLVYERLAKEDKLTGLKNRRAFDEFMADVVAKAGTYRDVFLVFMDLNHLKDVNDRYGHGVGDEMVIGAARCIEKAFQSYGECFLIGGDEFCAVFRNPNMSEEDINLRLDQEIERYNRGVNLGRIQLSIARGISSIRAEDGNIKSPGDWKREADLNMYKNKGWVRR